MSQPFLLPTDLDTTQLGLFVLQALERIHPGGPDDYVLHWRKVGELARAQLDRIEFEADVHSEIDGLTNLPDEAES